MLAASWAMDYFDTYLNWRKFKLFTYHKPLEKLSTLHSKTWYRLQEQMNIFDFTIHYKRVVKCQPISSAEMYVRPWIFLTPGYHNCKKRTKYFFYLTFSLLLFPSSCFTPSSSPQFTQELPTFQVAPANSLWKLSNCSFTQTQPTHFRSGFLQIRHNHLLLPFTLSGQRPHKFHIRLFRSDWSHLLSLFTLQWTASFHIIAFRIGTA